MFYSFRVLKINTDWTQACLWATKMIMFLKLWGWQMRTFDLKLLSIKCFLSVLFKYVLICIVPTITVPTVGCNHGEAAADDVGKTKQTTYIHSTAIVLVVVHCFHVCIYHILMWLQSLKTLHVALATEITQLQDDFVFQPLNQSKLQRGKNIFK